MSFRYDSRMEERYELPQIEISAVEVFPQGRVPGD